MTLPSFEDQASTLSRYLLTYLNPLLKAGSKRDITPADLGSVSKIDDCNLNYQRFLELWLKEIEKPDKKQSLWVVLWRTCGLHRLAWSLFLGAIGTGLTYGPIIILNQLVLHFEGSIHLQASILWFYVALIFILPMTSSLLTNQATIVTIHFGIQMRNALIDMIYRKALRLSPASRQKQSTVRLSVV
jgi:hypothetical protein